jgi:hypothetical protein
MANHHLERVNQLFLCAIFNSDLFNYQVVLDLFILEVHGNFIGDGTNVSYLKNAYFVFPQKQ